jgi:hypothetical protein
MFRFIVPGMLTFASYGNRRDPNAYTRLMSPTVDKKCRQGFFRNPFDGDVGINIGISGFDDSLADRSS